MCLYVGKEAKTIVATKDIVCYKVVKYKNDTNFAPLFINDRIYCKDKNYIKNYRISKTYKDVIPRLETGNTFINRGIHSYSDYPDDEYIKSFIIHFRRDKICVIKCVIPKGSRYITGVYSYFQYSCYASNQIKIVKLIK